jgi:hypothetical protein
MSIDGTTTGALTMDVGIVGVGMMGALDGIGSAEGVVTVVVGTARVGLL